MTKIVFFIIQLLFLLVITNWFINNSYPVIFYLNDIKITTSTSYIALIFIFLIVITYLLQRIYFISKHKYLKFKINKNYKNSQKGYLAFTQGMIALANKDLKKVKRETNIASKFLRDKTLNLLLRVETLKIEKKFDALNKVYEEMLLHKNTEDLALNGLMKQNLFAEDYHHAFIYGEKLFQKNPNIENLYQTLINIIGRTNNWYKLIEINDRALQLRLIDKKKYSINKSIAFYEISKIKKDSAINEATEFIEKALKLREYFPPYVTYYVKLLIEMKKFLKAKKYLAKVWNKNPYYNYKEEIQLLANKMKTPYIEIVNYIVADSINSHESKMLLASSFIDGKYWEKAKNSLSSLLEHKPSQEVCMLMAKIEEGETNDPQKINAWITRANFGELNKVWICSITNVVQKEWTSVSESGHFNSLVFKKIKSFNNSELSDVETNLIEYINN